MTQYNVCSYIHICAYIILHVKHLHDEVAAFDLAPLVRDLVPLAREPALDAVDAQRVGAAYCYYYYYYCYYYYYYHHHHYYYYYCCCCCYYYDYYYYYYY